MTTLRRELRTKFEGILQARMRHGINPDVVAEELADAALTVAGIAKQKPKVDLPIDWLIATGQAITDDDLQTEKQANEALMEFEKSFGYGTLPWNSTSTWDKFAKFIVKTAKDDAGWCADYVTWRAGDGKYKAFSNRKIRENPQAFIDTGYPEYDASKMYRKQESYGHAL